MPIQRIKEHRVSAHLRYSFFIFKLGSGYSVTLQNAHRVNKRPRVSAHLPIYSFLFSKLSLGFGLDFEFWLGLLALGIALGLEFGLDLD